MIDVMAGPPVLRLILEVSVDDQEIAGTIGPESGAPVRFTGWLGLVAAISAAAGREGPPGRAGGGELLEGRLEP
jgi:hypothetical protein